MPNYQDGKIYTIRNYTDNSLIYVGSSTQTLSKRLVNHRDNCKAGKKISLYSHITDNDWSNWYIELYEYYPCNNKTELEKREGQVIREIGTINKCIAGRTNKEYYEDNTEKYKEYYKNNVDKIKEYYEMNADILKEKAKTYRKCNADKIKEKNREKICCDICGAFIRPDNIRKHQKTKKCMSALN